MTIDRIDWHEDAINEESLDYERIERAGAHIGYYMEWAYKKGFAPNNPETHDVEEYQKVAKSQISGLQFLIENCDSKFWDVDLNEEGLKFTLYAYDTYLSNLGEILGHEPYAEKYNEKDLQSVCKYLDKVYEDYLVNPPVEQIKKEKTSLLNKIKNYLFK